MRITRWAEYGVHILAFIVKEQDAGARAVGASSIAEAQGIARDYTLQVLQRLREGGLLSSVRGPHGGYSLTRTAEEISLRDILRAAEGETFEVLCESKPLTVTRCGPEAHCGLRSVWYELRDHLDAFLDGKSLRAIVESMGSEEAELVQLSQSHATNDATSNGEAEGARE